MPVTSRTILIALVLKHQGSWEQIMSSVSKKEYPEDKYLEQAESLKCKTVTLLDAEYPNNLRHVVKPPFVLFYYGDLDILSKSKDERIISIVGDRTCSKYGKDKTKEITESLSKDGYVIVSTASKGIDTAVQDAILETNGKGVLVLRNGIDNKSENPESYTRAKLSDNYLIVSEYPNNFEGTKDQVIRRNRIVAGMCTDIVITEMHKKSSTMSTALFALNGNANIMCVPTKAGLESGCNSLIAQGATLVENSTDILNNLTSY